MTTLIIAEHEHGQLSHTAARLVSAAHPLGGAVDVTIIGEQSAAIASQAAAIQGVQKIYALEYPGQYPLAEVIASLVHAHFPDYDNYIGAATSIGKDCMPRLAALLGVAQVSDVIEIIDVDTFKHPIYAGNAIETVKTTDPKKVLTIRASAFDATPTGGSASIENLQPQAISSPTTLVKYEPTKGDRPELTAARVIISGGRGIGSAENFTLLEKIADKLGGAVGATRAAVDAGYVPNDYQIGQTGKIVAPDLYMAFGISGAIQHLAGIKDSKIIVAVNKDENAPIFEIADYGLVGDLFAVLPELEALL